MSYVQFVAEAVSFLPARDKCENHISATSHVPARVPAGVAYFLAHIPIQPWVQLEVALEDQDGISCLANRTLVQ